MKPFRSVIRYLDEKIHHRSRRERRWRITLWWVAALVIVLLSIDIHWSQGFFDFQYIRPHQSSITKVSIWLNHRAVSLKNSAQDLANDPHVRQLVAADDVAALQGVIEAKQRSINASGILVINAKGVALLRTQATGIRGDVVFESIAWGRRLATGASVATVESGTSYPLIIIGAVPIVEAGKVIGGIGIAQFMNDDFLRQHILPRLPANSIVSTYLFDRGIQSTSTQNETLRSGMQVYLNPGSDGMYSQTDEKHIIALAGKKYSLARMTFPGLETPIGGMIILVPFHELSRSLLLALLEGLVVIAITFALLMSYPHRARRWWIFFIIGGAAMVVRIFLTTVIPNSRTVNIGRPAFTMYNSTLAIDPPSRIYDTHYDQQVNLTIDSGGEPVNAVQVVIDFDPLAVMVKKVDLARSICRPDLVVQNSVDPTGHINIICGTPTPGYNKAGGIIATLTLSSLAPGRVTLHYNVKTNIRANDGIGTNVLRLATDGVYYFVDSNAPTQPIIYSPTNPNSDQWYAGKNVRFTWSGFGTIVRYSFSADQNTPPDTVLANASSLVVHPSSDGLYYLNMQALTNGSYGTVYHFPIRVDMGPPKAAQIKVDASSVGRGAIVRAHLQAQDTTSGLQRTFYLRVDKGIFYPVGQDVNLSFDKTGTHTLTMRALDQAGNYVDSSTTVKVSAKKK